jgi:hypothetical protein
MTAHDRRLIPVRRPGAPVGDNLSPASFRRIGRVPWSDIAGYPSHQEATVMDVWTLMGSTQIGREFEGRAGSECELFGRTTASRSARGSTGRASRTAYASWLPACLGSSAPRSSPTGWRRCGRDRAEHCLAPAPLAGRDVIAEDRARTSRAGRFRRPLSAWSRPLRLPSSGPYLVL